MGVDLHRHDEFSLFDGFGKATSLVKIAKEKGLTSLGIANHGNMNGLVEHYEACKTVDIKPILGVEAYFQPKFNRKEPSKERYHLCLFAQNLQGYKNLNRIMTISSLEQKYYKPIVDFDLLEKYSEGIICTTACIAGFVPMALVKGNEKVAVKALEKFKEIFKDNLYIELQPYKLTEKDLQEKTNVQLAKLAEELDIKCILASDSHYGNEEDYETYKKMHEIAGRDMGETYTERYMPTIEELKDRFIDMHGLTDFHIFDTNKFADQCIKNLEEIEDKCELDILGQLELELPTISHKESETLKKEIKKGLKKRGKYNKKYLDRCKQEYEVIKHHGFEDYFLIVQDYVLWAKNKGIAVGPGRGSVCNSQVAWALGITEVDSLYFDLDFRRFLRMDKKKLPDVDLDFETARRHEVIEYIIEKYEGKAAQICSYGLYKVDNLLNDLFKVCGVEEDADQKAIKNFVRKEIEDNIFDYDRTVKTKKCKEYNERFDNIILHFGKMFKKIRYIGTHAAGVAIVGGDLLDHVSLESRSKKISTAYDLNNLEHVNVIKFDILGLKTMSMIKELEELTGEYFKESWLTDKNIFEYFRKAKTDGIFQYEKEVAKNILLDIDADNINDIIAASALNRPGPLSLGMPEQYKDNKKNIEKAKETIYWKYTKDTYGTVIYQEQIIAICINIGLLDYADADRVLKFLKGRQITEASLRIKEQEEDYLRTKFVNGCKKSHNLSDAEANEIFDNITVYSFNHGHAAGYGLISLKLMYYKVYHPTFFWYVATKYAASDSNLFKYKAEASLQGVLFFLPHVNYTSEFTMRKIDGEYVIQEGLSSIKYVGDKAAAFIEKERIKNGFYKSLDDFIERCQVKGSGVNKRTIEQLMEYGALEFDKDTYLRRITKYNSTLYMKGVQ